MSLGSSTENAVEAVEMKLNKQMHKKEDNERESEGREDEDVYMNKYKPKVIEGNPDQRVSLTVKLHILTTPHDAFWKGEGDFGEGLRWDEKQRHTGWG